MNLHHSLTSEEEDDVIREGVENALKNVNHGYVSMSEALRGVFGTKYEIDEMALWFCHMDVALEWIAEAVRFPGYELFNVADDFVSTSPIPSDYKVRYWFLRTPYNYRLEIMNLKSGYSPFHSMFSESGATIAKIHASFKVPSEDEFGLVTANLCNNGFEVLQRCTSSYGRFNYLRDPLVESMGGRDWTLKPRVNLRDGAE